MQPVHKWKTKVHGQPRAIFILIFEQCGKPRKKVQSKLPLRFHRVGYFLLDLFIFFHNDQKDENNEHTTVIQKFHKTMGILNIRNSTQIQTKSMEWTIKLYRIKCASTWGKKMGKQVNIYEIKQFSTTG